MYLFRLLGKNYWVSSSIATSVGMTRTSDYRREAEKGEREKERRGGRDR